MRFGGGGIFADAIRQPLDNFFGENFRIVRARRRLGQGGVCIAQNHSANFLRADLLPQCGAGTERKATL